MIKDNIISNGHGALSPSWLVVHSTANVGATAANHASYWSRANDYAVHYVSDWREALHCVPDNRLCWHVGNGNAYTIGIEICEADNAEDVRKGLEIAAKACAEILTKHGWGIDRMITHNDARLKWGGTDHTDPGPYFSKWGVTFDQLKAMVQGAGAPEIGGGNQWHGGGLDIRYRVCTRANGWLPEMVDHHDTGGSSDDFAGIFGHELTFIAMDFPGWYQVRTVANGWLPRVCKYNPSDLENGCAGDGSTVTGIRCYYETQNPSETGWKAIEYQAHTMGGGWLPAMHDLADTGGSSDDFAGNGGPVDGFRARVVSA